MWGIRDKVTTYSFAVYCRVHDLASPPPQEHLQHRYVLLPPPTCPTLPHHLMSSLQGIPHLQAPPYGTSTPSRGPQPPIPVNRRRSMDQMQHTTPSIYDHPPPTVVSHLKGLNDYNYMAVLGRGHFGKVSQCGLQKYVGDFHVCTCYRTRAGTCTCVDTCTCVV